MELSGLHFLLSYSCNYACEHCFVWGSPRQSGTFTVRNVEEVLRQADNLGTVSSIYFEGGEPFLFYPILLRGARGAARMGFRVGIVTNGYWGNAVEDAREWLLPVKGLVGDLSVSSDAYHELPPVGRQAEHIKKAAKELGIPCAVISIAQPEASGKEVPAGQIAPGGSPVMYRGRAAVQLAPRGPLRPWREFTECPHEDLEEPGRLHVDAFGHLHICQGISVGNLFHRPLTELCRDYDVASHPVTGPLHRGGPSELVREYGLSCEERYADACHMCYVARTRLRERFPEILCPDQMYGAPDED